MKIKWNLISFLLFVILFSISFTISCTKMPVTGTAAPQAPSEEKESPPVGSWQQKWDQSLQAARKEGKVEIYASVSAAPTMKELIPFLKQRFGISLELTTGRSRELTAKIVRERSAGIFVGDILFGGLNSMYSDIKPAGILDPIEPALILPEVLEPKVWYGGELPLHDRGHYVFKWAAYPSVMMAINTNLVKPAEIKSYYDLLDVRWKDRIVFNDPTLPSSALSGFSSLIYNKVLDLDFFRKLVSQQSQLLRDERLQADWLAKGKYPVLLWGSTGTIADFRDAGAPIGYVEVKEGTYLSVGGVNLTLLKSAPHPDAARVFINWLLSKEGQLHMQKSMHIQSARVDIHTDDVDPLQLRKPGQKYFIAPNVIEDWVINEQDKYIDYARQVFAPLLK